MAHATSQPTNSETKQIAGGRAPAPGYGFRETTVIADVTQDMLLSGDEPFDPLAGVMKFEAEDDVLALTNDQETVLAGYFCTRDLSRKWRATEALDAVIGQLNTGPLPTQARPLSGMKQSGLGREGQ